MTTKQRQRRKNKLISFLESGLILKRSIEEVYISSSMYYDWRRKDEEFKRLSTSAIDTGRWVRRKRQLKENYKDKLIKLYLKKRWQIVRKEVVKRENGKCEICGKKGIDVHHKISPDVNPDLQFEEKNLMLLCLFCHSEKHPELPKEFFKKRFGGNNFEKDL